MINSLLMKMCEVLRYLNGSAIKLNDVFNWLKVVSGFEYTKTKIQEKAFTRMGYKSIENDVILYFISLVFKGL